MDSREHPVLVQDQTQGVLTLTMNRPHSLNALNRELLESLREALDQAAADDHVRVVVLTGAGRGFSSGQDLVEVSGDPDFDIEKHLRRYYHPVIRRLAEYPKLTIARVNGVAAGAGASLMLACDLKFADARTKIHMAFLQIGLVPDSGASYFLTRTLGQSGALEMVLADDGWTAEEALRRGLINRVAETGMLDPLVRSWAQRLAAASPVALRLIKEEFRKAEGKNLDEMLTLEARLQAEAAASEAHRIALATFLNRKRKADG